MPLPASGPAAGVGLADGAAVCGWTLADASAVGVSAAPGVPDAGALGSSVPTASVARNASSPVMGWPSEDVARHRTVYSPAGRSARSAWVTTASVTLASPSSTRSPSGPVTATLVPSSSTASLNVSVTCSGAVATTVPSAGSESSSVSCACAGSASAASAAGTSATVRRAARSARGGRREERGTGSSIAHRRRAADRARVTRPSGGSRRPRWRGRRGRPRDRPPRGRGRRGRWHPPRPGRPAAHPSPWSCRPPGS